MVDRETNGANFFETNLTATVGPTDLTYNVAANTITSPAFIIINPTIPASREVILADGAFTGTRFASSAIGSRYLDGSAAASGLTHEAGATVWVAPLWQHIEDLNDRIDAAVAGAADALATHEADTSLHGNQTYALIAEVTLAADGSFDFTAIPATYRHLRLVIVGRGVRATTRDSVWLRFNGDTGLNYDWQRLDAIGTAVTASEGLGENLMQIGNITAASAAAGLSGHLIVDVPDYARTTLEKAAQGAAGAKGGTGAGGLALRHGRGWWRNTAAVNRIFVSGEGGVFAAGTVASLYGIKGA